MAADTKSVSSPPTSAASKSNGLPVGVIVGISIGVLIGVVLAGCILLCFRVRRNRLEKGGGDRRALALPIRVNGVNSSTLMSDSGIAHDPLHAHPGGLLRSWWGGHNLIPASSGVTKFTYKELHKATHNFTAMLGQGAFGPVYKAIVQPSGTILAVKVLAHHSKQGDKEFQTEGIATSVQEPKELDDPKFCRMGIVDFARQLNPNGISFEARGRLNEDGILEQVMLLGRLHHRNLVNLVGYCEERGQRMLVYEYMSHGSLAQRLNDEEHEPLSWDRRVRIAQDVSRGIEYLHEGAIPPVVHRDIKSANILLDDSMTARVADFGLSKEASTDSTASGVRGTFGYVDPEYVTSNIFTEKSDVYSFGVLLFELITARNPQQGLMDYVHLAAMGVDGKDGWGELLDSRLAGKCNTEDLGSMAALAYKCVEQQARRRPRIRTVVQSLCKLGKRRNSNNHTMPQVAEGSPEVESSSQLSNGEWSRRLNSVREDYSNEMV